MQILLRLLRPHFRVLVLGLVLGLIANAANLAAPLATKRIIDTLGTGDALTGPITLLLVLVVIGSVIGLWQWILMGTLAEQVVLDARLSVIQRYFRARLAELTGRPTGELVTRVTADPGLLHQASSSIVGLINASLAFVATLVLMGTLDLVLLLCTLAAVAIVGAVMALLLPTISKSQKAAQDAVGDLGGELEGTLRAMRTVKASRAEQRQGERIESDARRAAAFNIRAARRAAWVWTVSWSGVSLAIIAVLGVGAWRADAGLLEVSSLIAFLLYAFQLMGPIGELTNNVTALQSGIAAARRISEVYAMTPETSTPAPGSRVADAPVLSVQGVSLNYTTDGPAALDDVTLTIPSRGHTAIVGPSGAGKTSLFSLLLRFLDPDTGEIYLHGRPYRALTHSEIRAELAYVEQEAPVVPGTIRENILFSRPTASDEELAAVLARVNLADKVATLPQGVDTPISGAELSGGERQRIALARALVRTPAILLLDEATAQMDALTEAAVQSSVRDRAATGAVVTIAHRLSTVIDADHIIVLDRGRVRATGTHQALLESDDLYRGLVEALRIAVPSAAGSVS
ncbi:putative ABC transporter ATP-binding protein [Paractinoplanes abujensis]|uniref:ATP-binding cassette subfamily B protein n=1 Tax=Paractinoplanes abujensis TaxID=882441 RepID=A0A7W7CXU5_9ACTN|nr:ABC transporter ATP-binding protein [Actinoplanes abujensis]MBB4695525.1 ATP-binding cassette subfamily B protein [Actinoplanes abujensis]GID23109.1 putative ABC transporter ATP-binding protein [Actinoplanes abujensis]